MAYNKKEWKNKGENGATDSNSKLDKNAMNDLENRIQNGFNDKVNKSGDTLTGSLTINNNLFEGFIKERNINNITYQLKLGIANKNNEGAICIQLNNKDTGEWLSEIVILSNGTILNGKTGQVLVEENKLYQNQVSKLPSVVIMQQILLRLTPQFNLQ